jgi:hypothetical protein
VTSSSPAAMAEPRWQLEQVWQFWWAGARRCDEKAKGKGESSGLILNRDREGEGRGNERERGGETRGRGGRQACHYRPAAPRHKEGRGKGETEILKGKHARGSRPLIGVCSWKGEKAEEARDAAVA